MAKAAKNRLYVFPLLILGSFIVFVLGKLTYNFFALSLHFSLDSVISVLLEALYSFKEIEHHLFPCFLFFTIGITCILLNRVSKKRALQPKGWILLTVIGFILILFGGRVLFVLTGFYPFNSEAMQFIFNAINESSLFLTSVLCFFIMFVIQAFDKLYLNAK